jgi:hypothetical protein
MSQGSSGQGISFGVDSDKVEVISSEDVAKLADIDRGEEIEIQSDEELEAVQKDLEEKQRERTLAVEAGTEDGE